MNISHIRHAWFPPAVPKRKHALDSETDAESEWPNTYKPITPGPSPRPAKRLRALEGGLAGLTIHNNHLDSTTRSPPSPEVKIQPVQERDAYASEAEPYMNSIYEYASPYPTTTGSSVVSLPLRGEVSEASGSDEEKDRADGRQTVTNVGAQAGIPGYVVYEPEMEMSKRKRDMSDDGEGEAKKAGKQKWFEPEKDPAQKGIVILDLESSEDESVTRSPRRRRSAFSLSSSSSAPSSPQKETANGRPRSQSQTDADNAEFVINPALLSHLAPLGGAAPVIPREEDPGKAVVLFRPAPWGTGVAPLENGEESPLPSPVDQPADDVVEMEASPLIDDEDAMDVDS
ncbi:hypothetical protein RhiLY_06962 [Ceratobasidium sp. AG-Ba]|nr:hypothetical protein RhiLY_06962 [Ceratobasidium sp. AG-Ba]